MVCLSQSVILPKIILIKQKSKIHGIGIFALKEINSGEIFYKIPKNKKYSKFTKGCANINEKWICDKKFLNWINHSCNPNSEINTRNMTIQAIKTIKPGEEITLNYNKTEVNGKTKIKCNCNSKNCRGYFRIIG